MNIRERAAREFFRAEIKNLEAANKAVIRSTAIALKQELGKQLRKFKKGTTSNGTFHRAIKLRDLKPQGALGFASIVRLGVPFMGVFEEGATIKGSPRLIILLPQGAALGFPRVSKGNPWRLIWAKISSRAKLVPASNGTVVAITDRTGATIPIYKIQEAVTMPKKLSFWETAERLSKTMADDVEALLNG